MLSKEQYEKALGRSLSDPEYQKLTQIADMDAKVGATNADLAGSREGASRGVEVMAPNAAPVASPHFKPQAPPVQYKQPAYYAKQQDTTNGAPSTVVISDKPPIDGFGDGRNQWAVAGYAPVEQTPKPTEKTRSRVKPASAGTYATEDGHYPAKVDGVKASFAADDGEKYDQYTYAKGPKYAQATEGGPGHTQGMQFDVQDEPVYGPAPVAATAPSAPSSAGMVSSKFDTDALRAYWAKVMDGTAKAQGAIADGATAAWQWPTTDEKVAKGKGK